MGRLIRSASVPVFTEAADPDLVRAQAGKAGDTASTADQGDGYLDRVAKYIPAEIIAFYIFVNSILGDAINRRITSAEPDKYREMLKDALQEASMAGLNVWWISLALFILALILIPPYFLAVQSTNAENEHPWFNIWVGILAFPFWAYAIDSVVFKEWHDGALASIMLATFTVISGAIQPGMLGKIAKAWK